MSKRSVKQESLGGMSVELAAAFRIVQDGTKLRRVKHRSIGSGEFVSLSSDLTQLKYHSRGCLRTYGAVNKRKSLMVSDFLEIREGWKTDNFHKASKKRTFQQYVKDKWLRENFKTADRDKNGTLSFEELWKLLKVLNLELDKRYGRQLFESCDIRKSRTTGGEDGLNEEEFIQFFRMLTQREELENIMKLWSASKSDSFQPQDLCKFMKEYQGFDKISLDDAKELIKKFEPDVGSRKKDLIMMSPNGFRLLLLSDWGCLCHRDNCKRVYQDMSRPMTDYFINSSHNTYLLGGQLRGQASIEGYISALKRGARLLELDVWDGDGEPIITHGRTLVRHILLVDVCKAINEHAFKYSPYPLILSIENHCSTEYQKMMAGIFKDSFGSRLLSRRFKDEKEMPSPNELRHKILVKAKRLPDDIEDQAESGEVSDEDEEPADSHADLKEPQTKKKKKKKIKIFSPFRWFKKRVRKLAKEFSKVVSISGTKLKDIDRDVEAHPVDSFVSLGENRMVSFLSEAPSKIRRYAAKHFLKSYPKSSRTSSSNMDPMPQWIAGVQIVTMNMQTAGAEMDLNDGFFKQNGGCGYVLKPKELRINGKFDMAEIRRRPDKVLKFRVISGQYLPKPEGASEKDVVDPYVTIDVIGVECDCSKGKTSVQRNNGFNPQWNEEFEFSLKAPELAMLRVVVKDFDRTPSANDFVGQFTVPICIMRKGYSHLHLSTGYDHSLDRSATLFVNSQIIG